MAGVFYRLHQVIIFASGFDGFIYDFYGQLYLHYIWHDV